MASIPKTARLALAYSGECIQCFPLLPASSFLTTGSKEVVTMIYCHADGALSVTYPGASAVTQNFVAGDTFCYPDAVSVTVSSGTFSLA